jgi:thiamine biosynthesis lipoprotein ApbE
LNEQVTRFALDRLAPDHAVLLRAYYGHGYVLNSKAMPLLQITEEEPDPMGGFYERVKGAGDPKKINGRLWEYAEWKPNRILVNQVSDEDAITDLRQMADQAVRFGITSMQIFPSMSVDRFARLLVKADLPIRVRAIPFSTTYPTGRDLSEIRQLGDLKFPQAKVTVSGMKWILDGTPIERGAALRRDYEDRAGWRGKLNFPETEIAAMVKESLDFKQQLLVHAVGDRAIQAVFDAMDKYPKVVWNSKRVRIEHGDGMIDDLVTRARKLGVIVVQNPTHFSEPELFHQRWGTKMFPLRSLIEAGLPVALGSDGPMNPFLNIMLATIHPYNPREAITREQAVRAHTYWSAFAEFAETEKGTISKGELADLAVLSQDIFTVPVPELPKTNSVMTLVGGKIVYDAKSFAAADQLFYESRPAMGTSFEIYLYAPNRDLASQLFEGAFEEIERVEAALSNYRTSSELSRINRNAADAPVVTDREVFDLLARALDYGRRTDGAFDITVGKLMKAWGFFRGSGHYPSDEELADARTETGWQNVRLDNGRRSVYFLKRGLELDLGGIGKGYALDRVAALLREAGVKAALISSGSSSIYAIGAPPGRAGWSARVPDPLDRTRTVSTVWLKDQSLSTSGSYEKFFRLNGRTYCHTMDPRTGRPVEGMLQTTVITPEATDSDALSTATFVMGPKQSVQFLDKIAGTAAMFVTDRTGVERIVGIHWPNHQANSTQQTKTENR